MPITINGTRYLGRNGVKWLLAVIVVAVGLVWFNHSVQSQRKLHVCNGLNQNLRVQIDGRDIVVGPNTFLVVPLAEGTHEFAVTQSATLATQGTFQLETSLWDRFFSKSAFILDPTLTSVIHWEEATYAARAEDSAISERFQFGRAYSQFLDVDFVFEEFPQTVDLKRNRSTQKTRVSMLPEEPQVLIAALGDQVASETLLAYAERHLVAGAVPKDLLRAYVVQVGLKHQFDRAFQFLAQGIARRPLELEWHRTYQTLAQRTNRTAEILDYYTKLIEQLPTDSVALYLRARIEPDYIVAASLLEQSIAADPQNPFPLYAACHQLRTRGQFAEAKAAVEKAISLDPDNREMDEILFQIRMALGEAPALERELIQKLQAKPQSYQLHLALLMSLSSQNKLAEIRRRQDAFAIRIKQEWPQDPFDMVAGSDRFVAYHQGDFERVLSISQSIKQPKLREVLVFEALVELGRWEQLEQTQFADHAPQRGYQKLNLMLGQMQKGRPDRQAHWFESAMDDFRNGDFETKLIASAFESPEPAQLIDRLDRIALQGDERALIALVAASRATGEDRQKLLSWAEQLNRLPGYPQKFVARTIAHLRSAAR